MHYQLDTLFEKAKKAAAKKDVNLVLTGILPSLSVNNVGEQNITETKRYAVLNDAIKSHRKQSLNIHIKPSNIYISIPV